MLSLARRTLNRVSSFQELFQGKMKADMSVMTLDTPLECAPCLADRNLSEVDVLVIGAGPTGLGAAKRLNQLVSSPHLHISHPRTRLTNLRMAPHG